MEFNKNIKILFQRKDPKIVSMVIYEGYIISKSLNTQNRRSSHIIMKYFKCMINIGI